MQDHTYAVIGSVSDNLYILEPFKSPGPGAYAPEKSPPQNMQQAPAYSMGSRTRYRKRKSQQMTIILKLVCTYGKHKCVGDSTPSPNTYGLPMMLGSHVPHRSSSASYSMAGRPKTGGFVQTSKTPGANAYKSIDPEITGNKAPVFSLYSRNYMPGGKNFN